MAERTEPPPTAERVGRANRDWSSGQIALWCAYLLLAVLVIGLEVLRLNLVHQHRGLIGFCVLGFLIGVQILGVAAGLRARYPGKWLLSTVTVVVALLWVLLLNPLRLMMV